MVVELLFTGIMSLTNKYGRTRHFRLRNATAGQAVRAVCVCGRAAGSRRRAVAALWRAAKAEGLPALPGTV